MNALDTQSFNEALTLANTGNKNEAHIRLRVLLITNPSSANLLLWLAFTSPDLAEAENYLRQAETIEPTNPSIAGAKNWLASEKAKQPVFPPPPAFNQNTSTYSAPIPVGQMPVAPAPLIRPIKQVTPVQSFVTFLGWVVIMIIVYVCIWGGVGMYYQNIRKEALQNIDNSSTFSQAYKVVDEANAKLNFIDKWWWVLPTIVSLGFAIWAASDATKIKNRPGVVKPLNPISALFLCILGGGIGFAIYMTARQRKLAELSAT